MYAVIKTGGKQYKVAEGERLNIERVSGEGDQVSFTPVLLVDGDAVIATPTDLSGASVAARIVGEAKGRKIRGFTYKPKKAHFIDVYYRTGLYHSPHLDRVEERLIVTDRMRAARQPTWMPPSSPRTSKRIANGSSRPCKKSENWTDTRCPRCDTAGGQKTESLTRLD